jgi:hypothetical protein
MVTSYTKESLSLGCMFQMLAQFFKILPLSCHNLVFDS